jgi:ABC-type nickel/cobalt efflux system permease component RcnA
METRYGRPPRIAFLRTSRRLGSAGRALAAAFAVVSLWGAGAARAHHVSANLASVEHYVCVTPGSNGVSILFDQHYDAFATRLILAREDRNRDGVFDEDERGAYLRGLEAPYASLFHLQAVRADGHTLALPLRRAPGSGSCRVLGATTGEQTLRMQWTLEADWPPELRAAADSFTLRYRGNFDHISKLYATIALAAPPAPMVLLKSSAPTPAELPAPSDTPSPLDPNAAIPRVTEAEAVLVWSGEGRAAAEARDTIRRSGAEATGGVVAPLLAAEGRLRDRLFALLRPPLGPAAWALCLLLCFAWGAMHALSPGHGKAIVSTYLIGMRARLRHVLLIGGVVTFTHTFVIVVVAIAALLLKDRFAYPHWLQPAGAALIVLVGLNQVRIGIGRLSAAAHGHHHDHDHDHPHDHSHDHDHPHAHPHPHDHDHDHEHDHGHGHPPSAADDGSHTHWGIFRHSHGPRDGQEPRTTWDLIAVGLSGGMVPCPSGIILLLFSLQIGQPALGLAGILSFSLGLAVMLIGVGWLALAGTRYAIRLAGADETVTHRRVLPLLPVAGGIVLVILGLLLLA